MKKLTLASVLLTCLAFHHLSGAVPEVLHHQGRVSVDGVNFDGTGQFKFLIYSKPNLGSPGNEVALWKNDDEDPSDLNTPSGAFTLPVSKGLYSAGLGGIGMAALPPNLETAPNATAYLRVWFNDGANGFQQLAPDQPLRSVPYALHAKTASTLSSSGNLNSSSVTTQTLTLGSGSGSVLFQLAAPGSGKAELLGDLLISGTGKSNFAGDVVIDNGLNVGFFVADLLPEVSSQLDVGDASSRWRRIFLGPQGINFGSGAAQSNLTFDQPTQKLIVSGGLSVTGALEAGSINLPPNIVQTAADNTFTGANVFTGNLSVGGNIQFSTPKVGKLQVSPSAFQPDRFTPKGFKADEDYIFPASGAPLVSGSFSSYYYEFAAPVQLPNGAVITKIDFFVFDEEGGPNLASFTGKLTSKSMVPPVSPGVTVIATAQSTPSVQALQSTTSISEPNVTQNNAYALSVRFITTGSTQNIGFLGATIHYTTSSLQP